MPELNIIFAGTPDFAAQALQALLHTSHKIIAVYTQPDRPAGRGRKLTASPVKQLAEQHQLPVHQPESLRNPEEQIKLKNLNADVMIVAAYGLILPIEALQAPKLGCINIHGSLLPRWRGAAPIQRAILAGDKKTGVTIMQMDKGLDTGAMLYKAELDILAEDTSAALLDKLAKLGSVALLETLKSLSEKQAQAEPQDNSKATYAEKISKEEAKINWNDSAENLLRKIHAFNPWPVASTAWQNETVRIWEAEVSDETVSKAPGTILHVSPKGFDVATGKGILRIKKLQFPGGNVISCQDAMNSLKHRFDVGTQLG